jgi:mono/diheme cytochrome c family protein
MKIKSYPLLIVALIVSAPSLVLAADAAANWAKNCAACHAKDGSGDTRMGKQLGCKDYRDPKVQAGLTDAKAISAIQNGIVEGGKQKMKAYKGTLTDEEIKALVAYIRTLKK